MKPRNNHSRCVVAAVAVLFGAMIAFFPRGAMADNFHLSARARVAAARPEWPADVVRRDLDWNPRETALILCDMWNQHWCQGATRRVAEMAPRMNDVVNAARAAGALVIHAPSDTMGFYRDHPGRKLAQSAPAAANLPVGIEKWLPRLADEPKLPIDDSDGGCDCTPKCPQGNPWRRQIEALEIAPGDAISDNGREIFNLLESRRIRNVLVMGVHTNMCVAGRPFGLRQMTRSGRNTVLVRDLTDSMYNSQSAPHVCHRRGTELVIQHLEQHVCPSVESADIFGQPSAVNVVLMIGEDEYDTIRTLPKFCAEELAPGGMKITTVHASDADPNNFAGIEALSHADLLVVSVRRRTPTNAQLAVVREHLAAGKPLVGIRTASHAFDREPPPGHARWAGFDVEVLGGHYERHYGNKPPDGPPTLVRLLPAAAQHAVLRGIEPGEYRSTSHLYRSRDLSASTAALAEGQIEGQEVIEPVAWTNTYRGGRVFYTSLGNPADFELPWFRRLLRNGIFWTLEQPVE